MPDFRNNHYVPKLYQKRFVQDEKDKFLYYLNLKPDSIFPGDPGSKKHFSLQRKYFASCFCEVDLYTTKFPTFESTEIEQKFFCPIDQDGKAALEAFASFEHTNFDPGIMREFLGYMSIQKLRTPKGLIQLSRMRNLEDRNLLLVLMQRWRNLYAAIWGESIWQIADASNSNTKFIISDSPVTVYNRQWYPGSSDWGPFADPDIWMNGTHTYFPLSLNKVLILTNLSWVRNPFSDELLNRPNPSPLRSAMMDIRSVQVERYLSEQEVREINWVTKKRAVRYVAAGNADWLYPEKFLKNPGWQTLGGGDLFMPDPRAVKFSGEMMLGYDDGRHQTFTEYGERPDEAIESRRKNEFKTFQAAKSYFAKKHGDNRRGRSFAINQLSPMTDSPREKKDYLKNRALIPKRFRK